MKGIIAIGTNLGQRQLNVARAIKGIESKIGAIAGRSRVIESEALLPDDRPNETQPPYLNGVVKVDTAMAPQEILTHLLEVERELGRDRSDSQLRWSARLIDLDLICLEDQVIDSDFLKLPHPEMHKRSFVLGPMLEVWPDWKHPILGRSVKELYKSLRL